MRILISSISLSGIIRNRLELVNSLLSEGHEVIILAPNGNESLFLQQLGCDYCDIDIAAHGKNPFFDLHTYKEFKHVLKTKNPDVVLLFTTKPNIYCGMACRTLNIPVIMNITGLGNALGNKGIIQHLMIHLYRKACGGRNVIKIFFQNIESKQFFEQRNIGNRNTFQCIPGSGVNLDKYRVQPFPISEQVDFIFVGRILKEKGIDQFIEAARIIKAKHKNVSFHVLGKCDKKYKGIIEAENSLENIIYHGNVDNIIDFERMSQCTIHPSYYPEGMSNAILEAAASGRAVITTDHSGCREAVEDGITGFIFPVGDTEKLTKAIEKFLGLSIEQRTRMGLLGRQKVEKEFDRRIVIFAYLNTINNIFGE